MSFCWQVKNKKNLILALKIYSKIAEIIKKKTIKDGVFFPKLRRRKNGFDQNSWISFCCFCYSYCWSFSSG